MKPTLYVMCGVGFSGKSTLAKKIAEHFNIPLVSQDGLFFEKGKELNIDQDDDAQWETLLTMCKQKIKDLLAAGKSVVFDNTNLTRKHRDELRELAHTTDAVAVVIYLDTPEELLNQRQEQNRASGERHDVKQEYLDEAKAQLEIPTNDENVRVFYPATNLGDFLGMLPK